MATAAPWKILSSAASWSDAQRTIGSLLSIGPALATPPAVTGVSAVRKNKRTCLRPRFTGWAFSVHSWGTLVALGMALRHPNLVSSLVLASGYYFPTLRPEVLLFALPGVPVIGDILSHTIWPFASRLTWKLAMNRLFAPAPISQPLSASLEPLTLRPKTVRAMGEDTAAMIPAAKRLSAQYGHVRAPVIVIAGEDDRIVSPEQSRRLQRVMRIASLDIVPDVGHMVHHSAVDEVAAAIERSMIQAKGTNQDNAE
jgi:pimeloyl-ACP methyl ester carboxylesterase